MPLEKHLILTGFMGSGKTAVGRILSSRLGVKFVDIDEEIVKKTGKSITEIFALPEGEEGFRRIESEVIKDVLSRLPPSVISVGGGAVLRRENRLEFRKNGIIINLRASPEEIYSRLTKDNKEIQSRPLLAGSKDEVYKRIIDLLLKRADAYADCDLSVNTDGKTPEVVADIIIGNLFF